MNQSNALCLVYITAPDRQSAARLSEVLLTEKLAACTNVLPEMLASFFWQEKLTQEAEVVLLAKTSFSLLPQLQQKVQEIHPYEIPCILALPIVSINQAYGDWLHGQLS